MGMPALSRHPGDKGNDLSKEKKILHDKDVFWRI
jgi:hypothetical protein